MKARILMLPGDGVGPEVLAEARLCLETIAGLFGHQFTLVEGLIGRRAREETGRSLPAETLAAVQVCDAALVGAVAAGDRDAGTDCLRELCLRNDLHTSSQPVRIWPDLQDRSPLRPDLGVGVDILFVRDREGIAGWGGDTVPAGMGRLPDESQLVRVVRAAFRAAVRRRSCLTAVDPADGRLARRTWRMLVDRVAASYPDISLEHLPFAACSDRLLDRPARFDVVLACGTGQDDLHRRAATLAGSPGLLPSATLGDGNFGVYEPAHGPAAGIAGQGRANPTAAVLSAAMLLRHSLELFQEARTLEMAVGQALRAGPLTADLSRDPANVSGTAAFGATIRRFLEKAAEASHG